MTAPLTSRNLLDLILGAIGSAGWNALVLSDRKPFRLRLFADNVDGFVVNIYVWNCTHGGGSARASDEYRIQFTGQVPSQHKGEVTLLLGWHAGYEVFVGWDIGFHAGQASKSPSAQVKELALIEAHRNVLAVHQKANGELVFAFRREFLAEYARSAAALHAKGMPVDGVRLLNKLESVTDAEVATVRGKQRQTLIRQVMQRYRAHDFRTRVLAAYGRRCAACGLQLELIDAAHIVPVASTESTDETTNGLALCKLHHAAFDRSLILIDDRFAITLQAGVVQDLKVRHLADGLAEFAKALRPSIVLPADRRDYPDARMLRHRLEWAQRFKISTK